MSTHSTYTEKQMREFFASSPFVGELGIELEAVGAGELRTSMVIEERHQQQNGFAHAGVIATLADHSAGCAAGTLMPAGANVLTIEFKLNLLRPAVGERLHCHARVLKPGRTVTVAESEIRADDDERLIAKATVTLAVIATDAKADGGQ